MSRRLSLLSSSISRPDSLCVSAVASSSRLPLHISPSFSSSSSAPLQIHRHSSTSTQKAKASGSDTVVKGYLKATKSNAASVTPSEVEYRNASGKKTTSPRSKTGASRKGILAKTLSSSIKQSTEPLRFPFPVSGVIDKQTAETVATYDEHGNELDMGSIITISRYKLGKLKGSTTLYARPKPRRPKVISRPEFRAARTLLARPAASRAAPVGFGGKSRKEYEQVVPSSVDASRSRFVDGESRVGKRSSTMAEDVAEMRAMKREYLDWEQPWQGKLNGWNDYVEPVPPKTDRPAIARLHHSLDRVLFSPGIHWFRDPRSHVFNFDPDLQRLPHPSEFAMDRFNPYITAGQDKDLQAIARDNARKFYGSTSTLTGCLSNLYFLLSRWKPVNPSNLSTIWKDEPKDFTFGAKLPASVILRHKSDGSYAVDNDKSYENPSRENILSELGKVMEKILTTTKDDLKRYLKTSPDDSVPEEERNAREAYAYSKSSQILMRSQLDAYDPRLPGTGVFDIKTRATIPIRHDQENYKEGSEYLIKSMTGIYNSFEREQYDLMRATCLKYSLQVRIGQMDGIFCAYHSTSKIFGFQYMSLDEIDNSLFGSVEMGKQSFNLSVEILGKVFDAAAACFPGESVNVTMSTSNRQRDVMNVFVQPNYWENDMAAKPIKELVVMAVSKLDGVRVEKHVEMTKDSQKWDVDVTIFKSPDTPEANSAARSSYQALRDIQLGLARSVVPAEGLSAAQAIAAHEARWEAQSSTHDVAPHLQMGIQVDANSIETANEAEAMKATMPALEIKGVNAKIALLRKLSKEGKKETAELEEKLKGKPTVVWTQGSV